MKNKDNLNSNELVDLQKVRETYFEIGAASVLREKLSNVYKFAETYDEAKLLFQCWIKEAQSSGVKELKSIARTFTRHLEGILGYWTTNGLTSASQEGFNNKIRLLIRQAYGYRDQEYFKLKIFDLPKIKPKRII